MRDRVTFTDLNGVFLHEFKTGAVKNILKDEEVELRKGMIAQGRIIRLAKSYILTEGVVTDKGEVLVTVGKRTYIYINKYRGKKLKYDYMYLPVVIKN